MAVKILDDEFVTIKDDIEKIQKKPTMYISFTGAEGVKHLSEEMTNNFIDEHNNPNSVSDGVAYIYADMVQGTITFEDHGRGIPFEELENTCTILQSGSKMDRANGDSAGENGVGLTVTNALSELFIIVSTRNGQAKTLKFIDGKKVDDRTIDVKNKDKHGLLVTFKPSKFLMGQDAEFPAEEFKKWLSKLSFFLEPSLVIHTTVHTSNSDEYTVYQNVEGIAGFLNYMDPAANIMGTSPCVKGATMLMEQDVPIRVTDKRKKNFGEIELVNFERTLKVSLSFNYGNQDMDTVTWAFCNNIEQIEGGIHLDAALSAITTVLGGLAKESVKKGENLEITQRDVLSGLRLVVNIDTTYSTKFTSQTKHKLGNKELYKPIRKLLVDALTEFCKSANGRKVVAKAIEMIRLNAQIRMNVVDKKRKIKSTSLSLMDSKLIVGYDQANLVGKETNGEELEIYIVEGTSAGDLCRVARFNNDIQGVLATFGKPANVYGKTSKEVEAASLKKKKKTGEEVDAKETAKFFHVLMDDILGCGYGSHFDITKLKYQKIILGSDADVDGNHIMGINVGNFYKHARPLIEAGKVYRVIAPLYKLYRPDKKGKVIDPDAYVFTKRDLYEMFENNASDKILLAAYVGSKMKATFQPLDKKQTKKFLEVNREYFEVLNTLSNRYKVSFDVIEFIIEFWDQFKSPGYIEKHLDKELHYDETKQSISGCYKGKFTSLILDGIVLKAINRLRTIYTEDNHSIMHYNYTRDTNKQGGGENVGVKSIGWIMADAQRYAMRLVSRFKGYGEMSAEEMRELVMNPDNRVLIQLTLDDFDEAKEVFDALFLKTTSKIKKQYIREAKFDRDDIDN